LSSSLDICRKLLISLYWYFYLIGSCTAELGKVVKLRRVSYYFTIIFKFVSLIV